jgi:glycerol-1-phosphate dehydrogenase [NAD(P)+]
MFININCKISIEDNLASRAANLLIELGFKDKKILFVSDKNILKNCKIFFQKNFWQMMDKTLILDNPSPDEKNLQKIRSAAISIDLIVALGSGTINDLCKLASYCAGIPYIIFPSAASMNGYLSENASFLVKGYKKSQSGKLPLAVFCDFDILKTAPVNMIKAGIGDSLCFYGCWFDWLLSHLILSTKFDEKPFKILEEKIEFFVKNFREFQLKNDDFLKLLMEILLLAGAGMTLAGGSYPSSQSEHLISHLFEAKYKNKIPHGLQIATSSITTAKIQGWLLKQRSLAFVAQKFNENFLPKKILNEYKKEYEKKINIDFDQINQGLKANWKHHRQKLKKVFFSEKKLREVFRHFKIKCSYKSFGISNLEYQGLVSNAKFTRNRFTCLDLQTFQVPQSL